MAFSNPETEEYANKLAKAGLLDSNARRRLEVKEGAAANRLGVTRENIPTSDQVTLEQVMESVNTKVRASKYETLKTINEEYSLDTADRTEDWQTKLADWTGENITPGRVAAFAFLGPIGGASTVAAVEGAGALGAEIDTSSQDLGINEERTAVTDFYRYLQEAGYEMIPPGGSMFPEAAMYGADIQPDTLKNAIAYASKEGDVPPDVLDYVMQQVEDSALDRAQRTQETQEKLIENDEIDRTNEENPLYAKNLAAFEILEESSPTKFQFDKETGAIYMTETGKQVDRRGKELAGDDLMGEAGAELVGGWPEGFIPQWEANPEGTAWGKLSVQAGVTVDEYAYNDILDVIENKEWYGADPSRYVAGQESFLGGFGSTYRVKVEETDVMRRTQATADVFGSDYAASRALGSYVWDAMKQDLQDTRRPWYDQNDNWAQFAGLSSENIAAVQSQMVAMGALEPDDIVYGTWGLAEATQMNTIMTIANGNGQEWTDLDGSMLKEFFDGETARTTPSRAAFTPQAFRPMDPARVEMTVRDSVRALVGRDPTEEDLQLLGGYLTDQYSSSYEADVAAGRAQYDAQIAADESGATYGQPGAVEDVDYEARFLQKMDERFEQQTASQERGVLAGKQQDMGVQMSSLMTRLGGGLG